MTPIGSSTRIWSSGEHLDRDARRGRRARTRRTRPSSTIHVAGDLGLARGRPPRSKVSVSRSDGLDASDGAERRLLAVDLPVAEHGVRAPAAGERDAERRRRAQPPAQAALTRTAAGGESFCITSSRLKLAGFCRIGNSLKLDEPLRDDGLRRHDQERAVRHPLAVLERLGPALERVGAQVVDVRRPQVGELPLPDVEARVLLLLERDLPLVDADGHQVAVVAPVEELLARRLLHLALEERHQVVAVEVDLERLAARLAALLHLLDEVRLAGRGREGRDAGPRARRCRCTTVPGLMTPGQRMHIGTRKPPSQLVAFSPRNGVLPPSGQLITSAPLSVV